MLMLTLATPLLEKPNDNSKIAAMTINFLFIIITRLSFVIYNMMIGSEKFNVRRTGVTIAHSLS